MAVDEEARAVLNQLLAEFATRADFGTWGEPADYSLLLRQDQPPASGSSQFKTEDLPMAAGTLPLRNATGEIVATSITDLAEEASPGATDWVLLQKADGTFKKVSATNLGGGDSLTAEEVAAAVWDAQKSSHTDAGSFGEEVQLHSLSTEVAALNNLSTADVKAEVDTALADYDGPTKAELDAGFAALNDLSATQVNAVVDTALADYDPPTKAEMDVATQAAKLAADGLDAVVAETGINFRQAMSFCLAALCGKCSGAHTTSILFKAADADTTRIEATIDTYGNRSAVTLTKPT